jgi:hypothetical protein
MVSQYPQERLPLRRHREGAVSMAATAEEVFAFIDDHSRFVSHVSQSSWMIGGGRMVVDVDAAGRRFAYPFERQVLRRSAAPR